jgi:hypothetical protein
MQDRRKTNVQSTFELNRTEESRAEQNNSTADISNINDAKIGMVKRQQKCRRTLPNKQSRAKSYEWKS